MGRSVGEKFRNQKPQKSGKGVLQLMETRKNVIRMIHSLDPKKHSDLIKTLQEKADKALELAKREGLSLHDAYALAFVK